jgi:hypothetical protein
MSYQLKLVRVENGTKFLHPKIFPTKKEAILEALSWDRFYLNKTGFIKRVYPFGTVKLPVKEQVRIWKASIQRIL